MIPARANPFRTERVLRLRYRLAPEGWETLWRRLARLRYRAALVGPEGSGKTTLLEDLESRLRSRGWNVRRLRFSRERRRPAQEDWRAVETAGRGDFLTVDGAEQLSAWRWRRVRRGSRRAGGLLVTSHRPGLLPSLREHRTDPELLVELVADLVGDEAAQRLRPRLLDLFRSHRGNLRDCLRQLYDLWAELS